MRTLLLLLLLICGSIAYGQDGTLTFTNKFQKQNYNTYIYLEIAPSIPDSMIVSDKDLFIAITGWNLLRYEIETWIMKKHPCNDYKCVDLRIINRGKATDYTFEEFRKILWP